LESSDFETFVDEYQSVAIPEKYLATIQGTVEEDEVVAIEDVSLELSGNDSAKSIETFSKIGRDRMDEDPSRRSETKHDRPALGCEETRGRASVLMDSKQAREARCLKPTRSRPKNGRQDSE
jgi:hypothetical protein